MMIPSARLSEMFGGKWVITVAMASSAIINLATPSMAKYLWLFIASRVLLGVCQAGIYPAGYAIAAKWLPRSEKSLGFALLTVGSTIGAVASTSMAGYLSEYGFAGGWPSVFYVAGNYPVMRSNYSTNYFQASSPFRRFCCSSFWFRRRPRTTNSYRVKNFYTSKRRLRQTRTVTRSQKSRRRKRLPSDPQSRGWQLPDHLQCWHSLMLGKLMNGLIVNNTLTNRN